MADNQPIWPLLLKVEDDDELILWDSENDVDFGDLPDSVQATIVDAAGAIWAAGTETASFVSTGESVTLDTLLSWLQNHAKSEGSCCVAKLYAPDFAAAMGIAKSVVRD